MFKKAIRNRQLTTALVILLAILIFASPLITVKSQGIYEQENKLAGDNKEKSTVIVTGQKYKMNYGKEQEIEKSIQERLEEIEKKEDIPQEKTAAEMVKAIKAKENGAGKGKSGSGGNGNGGNGNGSGNNSSNPGGHHSGMTEEEEEAWEKEKRKPRIYTKGLEGGKTYTGSILNFEVKAKDYSGKTIIWGNNGHVEVYADTDFVEGKWSYYGDGSVNYTINLKKGYNIIRIVAVDGDGNRTVQDYVIYGDPDAAAEIIGNTRFIFDLTNVGKGILIDETVVVYKDEAVAHLIERVLREHGYQAYLKEGSANAGGYFHYVWGKGLIDGYYISPERTALINREGGRWGESTPSYDPNLSSIGEGDFFVGSGWMYSVKDKSSTSWFAPNIGVSSYLIGSPGYNTTAVKFWWTNCIGMDFEGGWNTNPAGGYQWWNNND
ncbi:MAG: hypothetical protein PUK21_07185 [Peptostreptococcaceae bacterium]|nr:hypothetical protein [Peptostreptococcaceae bacterium]MDY5738959.1 hypothetical protein [Anaerovoracaceae bacterium]